MVVVQREDSNMVVVQREDSNMVVVQREDTQLDQILVRVYDKYFV